MITKKQLWDGCREAFERGYCAGELGFGDKRLKWCGCLHGYAQGLYDSGAISLELLAAAQNHAINEAKSIERVG